MSLGLPHSLPLLTDSHTPTFRFLTLPAWPPKASEFATLVPSASANPGLQVHFCRKFYILDSLGLGQLQGGEGLPKLHLHHSVPRYSDKRAFHLELQRICCSEEFSSLLFLSLTSLCICLPSSKPKLEC